MGRSAKDSFRALFAIADQQQGLFTAQQAGKAGYSAAGRVYHVRVGNWIRKARGVYQLADYPAVERPDLVLWSLWSRGVDDLPQGVYSHQTALSIFDLTDQQPAKLHLTVPKNFRRRSEIPEILVLHRQDLEKKDVMEMTGFSVTRPFRAIVDLLNLGDLHTEVLKEALEKGMERGLITIAELRSDRGASLLSQLQMAMP